MLDKRKRGTLWIGVSVFWNLVFILYLFSYSSGGGKGEFIGLFPEAFVTLTALVGVVVVTNALLGWYYLGKPDVTEVYKSEAPTQESSEEEIKSREV